MNINNPFFYRAYIPILRKIQQKQMLGHILISNNRPVIATTEGLTEMVKKANALGYMANFQTVYKAIKTKGFFEGTIQALHNDTALDIIYTIQPFEI